MSPVALELLRGGKLDDTRGALRELYQRYGGSVFSRCSYLLRDPAAAEDAMQDVFARAMVNWSEFRAEASPLTWLTRIATNHCLNLLRAERAGWRERYEAQEKHRPEGQGGPMLLETRDLVRKLLSRFDVETQSAVVHYHLDGMTLEEVAELLGRSVPTIRKRLTQFAELGGQEFAP